MLEEYHVDLEKEKQNTCDLSEGRFALFKGRDNGAWFCCYGGMGHGDSNPGNPSGHDDFKSASAHRPAGPVPAGGTNRRYSGNPL